MPVFPVRRAVAVVGAVVLSGAVFAAPASAADLPLVGSDACETAVAAVPAVRSAEAALRTAATAATSAAADVAAATTAQATAAAALNALPAGDPGFEAATKAVEVAGQKLDTATRDKQAADDALGSAQTTLTAAVGTATGSLCADDTSDGPTTTPAPTTTTPAPSEQPDPDVVAARIAAQIDTLSCDDYRDELAAIRGALLDTDTQTLLGTQRVGELLERLRLRNVAINSCVSPAPVPTSSVVVNGDVTVNPLDDDDSVADATQIRIVPQGSVSTGGA